MKTYNLVLSTWHGQQAGLTASTPVPSVLFTLPSIPFFPSLSWCVFGSSFNMYFGKASSSSPWFSVEVYLNNFFHLFPSSASSVSMIILSKVFSKIWADISQIQPSSKHLNHLCFLQFHIPNSAVLFPLTQTRGFSQLILILTCKVCLQACHLDHFIWFYIFPLWTYFLMSNKKPLSQVPSLFFESVLCY